MKLYKGLKTAGLVLALFFCMAIQVSAQKDSTAHSPEARARTMTDKMKTELSLSDDQYTKVYEINLKYAQKNQEALKAEGSRMSKLKAMKTENAEKNSELKTVLSQEQFDKYKSMQKEMRSTMKQAYKSRKNGDN